MSGNSSLAPEGESIGALAQRPFKALDRTAMGVAGEKGWESETAPGIVFTSFRGRSWDDKDRLCERCALHHVRWHRAEELDIVVVHVVLVARVTPIIHES